MKKRVKIVSIIQAFGNSWSNCTVDSVHDVVDPPKNYKHQYPNTETSAWVLGADQKVRLVNDQTYKEFCYVD